MEGWVANHPVRERMKLGFVDYHQEGFQRENDFGVEIIGLRHLLEINNATRTNSLPDFGCLLFESTYYGRIDMHSSKGIIVI